MSINQAFIKAYRHDPPRPQAPPRPQPSAPTQVRPATSVAAPAVAVAASKPAWQSSVEIVTPASHWPALAGEPPTAEPARPSTIGKRPLSSFAAVPNDAPSPAMEPRFVPETTISAFHWPPVCRALWQQHSGQYEQIAKVLAARRGSEPRRGAMIGVASLHAGDGATTNLLCLAAALAADKRSVILVDGNFRAPRLAGLLGVQPTTSWQDVLKQGLSVAEAVIHAEHDRLDLLPLDLRDPGAAEPNGAPLAAGLQTVITAGVLRYAYQIVLVDLGAILAPRAFTTISHLVRNMRIESAVAVTDPKHAEQGDLAVAGELLDETGCELLGTIENKTNTAR